MTELDERPTLDERLAAILAKPRLREVVAARRAELAACNVPACSTPRPAALFPRGYRCPAHAPAQPRHLPPLTSSPDVRPLDYGTLTLDPAGRNGEGWELGRDRIPRWRGDGPEVRR